ncbi:MAG: DNA alkylation repair protein [Chloroflexota bacterium]|nr:DNA alkylation repair protein [Chloroflexota bacterium]
MTTVNQVLQQLQAKADPEQLEGMARYGMTTDNRMGVKVPEMRKIAKKVGKNHQLALELWDTGIAEARIVASLVDDPALVSEVQMDDWVAGFNSWDVCDQVCMNLFDKTPYAWLKLSEWSTRKPEYEKRAAYALIAVLAVHDKGARDEQFSELLPLIKAGADDGRNYVKKAVSWALRNIGKRSPQLRGEVLDFLPELEAMQNKTASWIARDTFRDLNSDATKRRMARMGDGELLC